MERELLIEGRKFNETNLEDLEELWGNAKKGFRQGE